MKNYMLQICYVSNVMITCTMRGSFNPKKMKIREEEGKNKNGERMKESK